LSRSHNLHQRGLDYYSDINHVLQPHAIPKDFICLDLPVLILDAGFGFILHNKDQMQ